MKKVSKNKLQLKSKPWITSGIQKYFSLKNKLLSKFIKLKDADLKSEDNLSTLLKKKLLSTLLKGSKQS